jgi:hypothetical protein
LFNKTLQNDTMHDGLQHGCRDNTYSLTIEEVINGIEVAVRRCIDQAVIGGMEFFAASSFFIISRGRDEHWLQKCVIYSQQFATFISPVISQSMCEKMIDWPGDRKTIYSMHVHRVAWLDKPKKIQ